MKEITRTEYLVALGLFTLAKEKSQELDTIVVEVGSRLGLEDGSHVHDEIYSAGEIHGFDKALELAGITVI